MLHWETTIWYAISWSTINFPGWTAAATGHQPMWVVSQVQHGQAQPPRHQLDTDRHLLHEVHSSLVLCHRPTQHSIILLTHNAVGLLVDAK